MGGEGFLEGGELARGILAAVEQVGAVEVDAGAEHDGHHGGDVVGRDDGAAMVGDLHAAAHFGGHEGRVEGEVGGVAGGRAADGSHGWRLRGADGAHIAGDAAAEAEGVDLRGRELLDGGVPGCVGIAAVDGQDIAMGDGGAVPAGDGVEGHAQAGRAGEFLELEDVRGAAVGAAAAVFVLDLDGDDRAALAPHKAFELGGDLLVVEIDVMEVGGVVGAGLAGLGEQPVGETAVADFGVRPRADAGDDVHAVPGTKLDEVAEIFLAGPVPLAFDFLVEDPDDVSGDDLDAGRLHLENFGLPLGLGDAGVMHLAHDGEPGLAVEGEVLRVEREHVAVRGAGVGGIVGIVCGTGSGSGGRSVDDEGLWGRGLRGEYGGGPQDGEPCGDDRQHGL